MGDTASRALASARGGYCLRGGPGSRPGPRRILLMATQSRHRLSEPVSARDHIRGPRSAVISLVEYGDFECPYCRAAEPIIAGLMEAFGGELSVTFRHFPMLKVHPHAQHAAEVAE